MALGTTKELQQHECGMQALSPASCQILDQAQHAAVYVAAAIVARPTLSAVIW